MRTMALQGQQLNHYALIDNFPLDFACNFSFEGFDLIFLISFCGSGEITQMASCICVPIISIQAYVQTFFLYKFQTKLHKIHNRSTTKQKQSSNPSSLKPICKSHPRFGKCPDTSVSQLGWRWADRCWMGSCFLP